MGVGAAVGVLICSTGEEHPASTPPATVADAPARKLRRERALSINCVSFRSTARLQENLRRMPRVSLFRNAEPLTTDCIPLLMEWKCEKEVAEGESIFSASHVELPCYCALTNYQQSPKGVAAVSWVSLENDDVTSPSPAYPATAPSCLQEAEAVGGALEVEPRGSADFPERASS